MAQKVYPNIKLLHGKPMIALYNLVRICDKLTDIATWCLSAEYILYRSLHMESIDERYNHRIWFNWSET